MAKSDSESLMRREQMLQFGIHNVGSQQDLKQILSDTECKLIFEIFAWLGVQLYLHNKY